MAPAFNVRLLRSVSVPTELLPGASAPPSLMMTGPRMKPLPPSVPPRLTVTEFVPVAEPEVLLASSVPPFTTVGPVCGRFAR